MWHQRGQHASESDDGALAIIRHPVCSSSLGRNEVKWEGWPLQRVTGGCVAQRKRSKLAFVRVSFFSFFFSWPWGEWAKRQLCVPEPGGEGGRRSLRQVVEAHGHADVAGEADVDAEVDQPLFARTWRRHRRPQWMEGRSELEPFRSARVTLIGGLLTYQSLLLDLIFGGKKKILTVKSNKSNNIYSLNRVQFKSSLITGY